jgi:hypothetical protein
MSRLRTIDEFQDRLDTELAWRIQEFSTLDAAIKSVDSVSHRALIRASIAMAYAHWEGFVKNASTHYVEFVGNRRLNYSQLTSVFAVIGLRAKLSIMLLDGPSRSREAFDFVRSQLETRARLVPATAIDAESNLSSTVFRKILETIGLEASSYESYSNFIDKSLLKKRNSIAHGELIELDRDGWISLRDTTLQLIRMFKSDLENAATLKKYRA